MSKEDDVRSAGRRQRNLLYLIHRYLKDNCFNESSECLKNEAKLQDDFEVCDNVDLDSIYLEYASFYQVKFGKYPKILKKITANIKMQLNTVVKKTKPAISSSSLKKEEPPKRASSLADSIQIIAIPNSNSREINVNPAEFGVKFENINIDDEVAVNGLQDLEHYAKLAIVNKDLGFRWKDFFGDSRAMDTIKEAVLIPLEHPELFTHQLKPWKSLLLHGPPGKTSLYKLLSLCLWFRFLGGGKTLLARILCSETYGKITFFNVTSSCITSKWRGESEKIVKALFHYAKLRAPSVLFFDEVDALTSNRDRGGDHEATKRFKNEFLQMLDGLEDITSSIFVLASTNIPWDIDPAFLRRFEKKILISLPSANERRDMIERFLETTNMFSVEILNELTASSAGFTGDQIRLACKEAAMNQIRKLAPPGKLVNPLTPDDLKAAFKTVKPIDPVLVKRHTTWSNINGT